jgi:hypothetical protein
MSSPVHTIVPSSTVGEALALMDKHTVRQVIVSFRASVIGIVNRDRIFETMHKTTLSAAASDMSGSPACIINPRAVALVKDVVQGKFACPYCGSPFDDKEALSRHIDRLHGGSGALEGDFRRMFE